MTPFGQTPDEEDEDQLDPRTGLYAYLSQKAAFNPATLPPPANYRDVIEDTRANADAKAANSFGASLQNAASMAGSLNGKRSDYSGPAELAKNLDKAGQENISGDYKLLGQDNARQRLYANLAQRSMIEQGRNDRAAIAEKGRNDRAAAERGIKGKRADVYAYRFGPGGNSDGDDSAPRNGNFQPVYPKDGGDPYLLDKHTGEMRPLPKAFTSVKDRQAGLNMEDQDEPLNKDQTRDWNKLQDHVDPSKQRSGDMASNQKMISSADRILQLGEQGKGQKGGLDSRQIHEIAIATAGLLSGGGTGAAQSTVEALVPNSKGRVEAAVEEWLTSNPTGTDQQAFVNRMMDTAHRERHLANEKVKTSINNTYQASPLWDVAPNRMNHSYYRQMGDDAAYDEAGRYIQEPYVEGAAPSMAVGQSPVQLQAPTAQQQAPGAGYGPSQDAGQYQQDMADAAWGKAHGLTFEQAKTIRDKRRAASGR